MKKAGMTNLVKIETLTNRIKSRDTKKIDTFKINNINDSKEYWVWKNTINAESALRNNTDQSEQIKMKSGSINLNSGTTQITWIWFRPKYISAQVRSISKWISFGDAYMDWDNMIQKCLAVYPDIIDGKISTDYSLSRLFRTSWSDTWSLVSFNEDGFTINSSFSWVMFYNCIW